MDAAAVAAYGSEANQGTPRMSPFSSATPMAFIYVSDRARTLAFYTGTLGFTVRDSDDYGELLELGGALLRITVMPDQKPHAHPVFGWDVADMDAAADALGKHGIAFTVYEGMGQDARGIWTAPDGKSKLAWFSDPDGNVLMVTQG